MPSSRWTSLTGRATYVDSSIRIVWSMDELVVGWLGEDGAELDGDGLTLVSSDGPDPSSLRVMRSTRRTAIATSAITPRTGQTQLRRSSSATGTSGAAAGSTWVPSGGGTAAATTEVAAVAGLRRAPASSRPSRKRWVGSLASARRTTAARSAGTEAGRSGTGSRRWASAVATAVSPTNGRRPARHSKATTPSEYTSEAGVAVWPWACSGEKYCGVPITSPVLVSPTPSVARAMPKSVILTVRSGVTSRLAGFTSRCTMPASWAAPSPSAAWASSCWTASGVIGSPGRRSADSG